MPVFVIGVDPHKSSHTVAVLDTNQEVIAECRFDADGRPAVADCSSGPSRSCLIAGRWRERPAPTPCWPVSSSPPGSRS